MNIPIQLLYNKLQKIVIVLILACLISNSAFAQEYIVSIKHINITKSEIVSNSVNGQIIPQNSIIQVSGSESILQDRPQQITLELGDILPDDSYSPPMRISLETYDIVAPEVKFTTGTKEGDRIIDFQFANYKGKINDDDWINLSFSKAGTICWMRLSSKTYIIQPCQFSTSEAEYREHFISEISNQNQDGSWCGVNTESLPPEIKQLMASLAFYNTKSFDSQLTAKLAIETDYETYESFGKDSLLTTAYLLSIVATVSQIYEQEVNIKLMVVFSRVWATPDDPYTLKGYFLLNEFQNYWNANMQSLERDAAVLVIEDPARLAGGVAFLDALGDKQNAYAICGGNIITVTHELGHLFGSPHTHNCSWPAGPGGTLAPIDQCATVEGDCDIDEIVPQEGTIMSYCPTRAQIFGPLVSNLIRSRAEAKLGTGEVLTSTVTGKVTSNGSGLSNVSINVYRGDGSSASTTTIADGSFLLNLFYDDYTISADREGFLIKPIRTNSSYFYVTVAGEVVTGLNFEAIELNADQFEPDDNINQAASISTDASIQLHTLHSTSDRDFVRFDAVSGKYYFIGLNLGNVLSSPTLTLLDTDGTTVLQAAFNPPLMIWQAPQNGTYFLHTGGSKGFYGLIVSLAPFLKVTSDITPLEWCDASWGDYDANGDLDLLISGRNDNSTQIIVLFRNDNGSLTQTETGIMPISNFYSNVVKWVDIDNDGDLDAFTGGGNFAYIYLNNGGSFTSKITIDDKLDLLTSADFGDYDNDGDLDILVQSLSDLQSQGDIPLIHLYRNDHGVFQNINLGLRGVDYGKAIWVDYDGDGDLDILVAGSSNKNGDSGGSDTNPFTKLYRNEQGSFSDANVTIVPVASFPDIAFGDYDSDGDPDLAIAGKDSSKLVAKIYNNENGIYTDINAGLTGVRNANLEWGDYDNDGDLDLIITGQYSISAFVSPLTKLYLNKGSEFEEAYFNSVLPSICAGSVNWFDNDNDSDLDLLLIGEASNMKGQANLLRNETSVKNFPPSAPTGLSSSVDGSKVTLSWIQAQDDRTPSLGLTYNLCIGTTPGGIDVLTPMSDLITGRRQIVDIGNAGQLLQHTFYDLTPKTYYWTVQAIDNSLMGGAFAPIQSFEISNLTSASEFTDNKKGIEVYPNPATDVLTIDYQGNNREIGFEIYNSIGQIVCSGRIMDKALVQTASFLPGIYLIKLETGNTVKFNKIIKK